jgi:hypothetical protein
MLVLTGKEWHTSRHAPDKARQDLSCLPVTCAFVSPAFKSVIRVPSSQTGLDWSGLLRCVRTLTHYYAHHCVLSQNCTNVQRRKKRFPKSGVEAEFPLKGHVFFGAVHRILVSIQFKIIVVL